MRNYRILMILVVAVLLVGVTAVLAGAPVSSKGIEPVLYADGPGGNTTCADIGNYQFSSGRIDYIKETGQWKDENDVIHDSYPYPGISVTTDGTYVNWSSSFGIGAVIVKGGPNSNVYSYDPQDTWDNGLASPINESNPNKPPYGLSNLTFCWNPEPVECEWIGETAWAAGSRYVNRGNWATFTPYGGSAKSVTLFAGQTMAAGTVYFSDPVGGIVKITIVLNPGWRFADVAENVKIQDYAAAPSGNPAPGLFAHKAYATGSPFDINVPKNKFYGVHVNVEWEKCD